MRKATIKVKSFSQPDKTANQKDKAKAAAEIIL